MSGEKNLQVLLSSLSPELDVEKYVFAKVNMSSPSFSAEMSEVFLRGVVPVATFVETEGLTLVIKSSDHIKLVDMEGFEYSDSVFSKIVLKVHSSLDAVGLTAVVATKLTEFGISANVVAAYYHDHFFVQSARADEAVALIRKISTDSGDSSSS